MVITFDEVRAIRSTRERNSEKDIKKKQPRPRAVKSTASLFDECYGKGFSDAMKTAYRWCCQEREQYGGKLRFSELEDPILWYPKNGTTGALFIDPDNNRALYRTTTTKGTPQYYELTNYCEVVSAGGDAFRRLVLGGLDLCDSALAESWARPLLMDCSLDNILAFAGKIKKTSWQL